MKLPSGDGCTAHGTRRSPFAFKEADAIVSQPRRSGPDVLRGLVDQEDI
jgi:hypothetical protein